MTDKTTISANPVMGLDLKEWKPYAKAGVVGLVLIWLLVIAYLLFWPRVYTSSWGLLVLGKDPTVSVNLQGIGQASTDTSARPAQYQDPRDDYIFIATSIDTLTAAAERVDLELEEFGEPDITVENNSAIIAVEFQGDSPEQAQNKSIALYEVLFEKIESLRQQETARRKAETLTTLEQDQNGLAKAQDSMTAFKKNSSFHSENQLTSLATSVEGLRTKLAEKMATLKGIEQKLAELSKGSPEAQPEMQDVYILQADPVYQKQFSQYAELYSTYSNLEAGLGYNNPTLLATKGELEAALYAMRQRASFLLKKEVTERFLVYINSPEWVTSQSEYIALVAEINELENQIRLLDERLSLLDHEKNSFSRIQADFMVSESVLAGTLAKLNFNQSDIYSIYPPIQLVVAPNLPDDPTSPDLANSFLAGVAGSFLLVVFLVFLKWERNSPWRNPREWVPQS